MGTQTSVYKGQISIPFERVRRPIKAHLISRGELSSDLKVTVSIYRKPSVTFLGLLGVNPPSISNEETVTVRKNDSTVTKRGHHQ